MSIAEKHMANGQTKLDEFDLSMAAFYFETAAEEYVKSNDFSSAVVAYEKVLYCLELDEQTERVGEIKNLIKKLKNK